MTIEQFEAELEKNVAKIKETWEEARQLGSTFSNATFFAGAITKLCEYAERVGFEKKEAPEMESK